MSKVREFIFSGDSVVVTFADGTMAIAQFRRRPDGAVEIAGQRVGHAETAAEIQLVIRKFFVDEYAHA